MNIILFTSLGNPHTVECSDHRYDHIVKVLHLAKGDSFRVGEVNGPGGTAIIVDINSSSLTFTWEKEFEYKTLYPVSLLVAQVRPICMKRILREAVSLGVAHILVVGTDTGEKSYREAKLWSTGEYHKYLLDGAMQSGYTALPKISFFNSVDDVVKSEVSWDMRIVLDNDNEKPKLSHLAYIEGSILLAIGPERGWSPRERAQFDSYGYEFRSLGNRILRTETACSAGLAILLSRMGIM